jgi:hypothetical protein
MGATTTTVVTALLVCGVVALLVALLLVRRGAAADRARREQLERDLREARTDVTALSRRLDALGHEVLEARSAAERAAARSAQLASRTDREFVITTLGDSAPGPLPGRAPSRGVGAVLEERLVRVARRHSGSSSGAAASRLAVSAAALGHGLRRALSPEVLDRAAAEATVARRRSRRDRKRELREARRVLRSVQERPPGKHVA